MRCNTGTRVLMLCYLLGMGPVSTAMPPTHVKALALPRPWNSAAKSCTALVRGYLSIIISIISATLHLCPCFVDLVIWTWGKRWLRMKASIYVLALLFQRKMHF